jgi:DNA transformation protein and related proteins
VSPEDIRDLFAAFGPVSVRRLFGGAGIYAEGVMFALVHQGVIYLKADGQSAAAFEREGLAPFTYATREGARELASYRRMPDRLYDAPDELVGWAREALAAARRGANRAKADSRSKAKSKTRAKAKAKPKTKPKRAGRQA